MKNMTLEHIAQACGGTYIGEECDRKKEIQGAVIDSRLVEEGAVREHTAALEQKVAVLQQELAHTKHLLRIYARGVRVRTGIIFVLCAVLTLALIALIIDLRNPNVGWVRAALRSCVQV